LPAAIPAGVAAAGAFASGPENKAWRSLLAEDIPSLLAHFGAISLFGLTSISV